MGLGHGSFCLVSHHTPVLGLFQWMPNSAHKAKRPQAQVVEFTGLVKEVYVDSKAEDQKLYQQFKQDHRMQLLPPPRRGMDKPPARQQMIQQMRTRPNRKIYHQRLTTVEPMQGLVKELFDLDTCWRRGDANNRWLLAAMGTAVQMAQHRAYRCGTSTWNITEEVLGL